MKKTILALIILIAIGALAYALMDDNAEIKNNTTPVTGNNQVEIGEAERFEGTITAYDTGCFVDAICSVSVDGKTVILVTGGRLMAGEVNVGTLQGVASIGDLETKVGSRAEVYALKVSDTEYTLYGDASYYVLVK